MTVPGAPSGAVFVTVKEKNKGFVWSWKERVHPQKARVPSTTVIAARTRSVAERDMMIASDPRVFFTEPHYNGFPAVLIRLDEIPRDTLEIVIEEAWRCLVPKELADLIRST